MRGHGSSDGRPAVKIGGFGQLTTADAADYAAGKTYVRKRHLAPYAQSTAPGPFPESFLFRKNELQEPLLANSGFTTVPEGHGSEEIAFVQHNDASTSSSAALVRMDNAKLHVLMGK